MASKPNQPLLPGMSDESENSARPSSAAATPSNPPTSAPIPTTADQISPNQSSVKNAPCLSISSQQDSSQNHYEDSAAENNFNQLKRDATESVSKNSATPLSKSEDQETISPTQGHCPLVVVVDTSAILYQMFHALPPMTSPQGMPVGAVHGFLRDLLEIQNRYQPDYLFFAFDLSEITFRNELYTEYKAHRDEMPADLRLQIPLVRQALEALNVPILEQPGYEADDLIATIATQSEQKGWRCLIVSPDKDCRQLLSDRIDILNLRKKELFTKINLEEEWGITPEQVIDFQAMVGDSADNVPGIPLIGPKIAQQLLEQYGSLDQILQHPNA
ncbi:MAG: polymerase, partial [Planctomycetota bacterium]